MEAREILMSELLDHLGLEYTQRNKLEICPFCGSKKSLSFNDEKGMWICPKCKPQSSGRVLHFYAKYVKGLDELPGDKTGRRKLAGEMREFMGYADSEPNKKVTKLIPPPKKADISTVPVAPDKKLHAVYSAMATLPFLALTKTHRKNLQKRGLTDEAIEINGYRSIPDDFADAAPFIALYEQEGGEEMRQKIFDKWRYPAKHIQLGLKIAAALISMGHDLQGVPGFYKFGNSWCFWVNPGILIPTRNLKGEIVVWQVRQSRDPKYLTCHCGTLPGAVTVSVSRCHFPLCNAPLSADTTVIFTEGPLKADVALCLYGKPAFFAAIPGIKVTEDLLRHIEDFRSAGVKVMQNGFDMDKLTNPNVIEGSALLMKEIRMRGVAVQQLYWGDKYARYKLMSLTYIAKTRNVKILPDEANSYLSVFDQLHAVSLALSVAKIQVCKSEIGKKKMSFYWEPETKGIDDYYLSLQANVNPFPAA